MPLDLKKLEDSKKTITAVEVNLLELYISEANFFIL
jgi:hypothetical protein